MRDLQPKGLSVNAQLNDKEASEQANAADYTSLSNAAFELMDEYRVPYDLWHPSLVTQFNDWVQSGIVRLRRNEFAGRPTLHMDVAVVCVRIYVTDPSHRLRNCLLDLYEDKQIFRDGRIKERRFIGLGEKIKKGETSESAARRCLAEELGQTEPGFRDPLNYKLRHSTRESTLPMESDCFPGLLDVYHRTYFVANLANLSLFHENYVEASNDKETHFTWRVWPG